MSSLDRSPSDGTRWEAPSMARSRGGEVVHRRGLRPAGWRGLRGGSRVAAMPGTWRANEYLVVSFLVGTATFTLLPHRDLPRRRAAADLGRPTYPGRARVGAPPARRARAPAHEPTAGRAGR